MKFNFRIYGKFIGLLISSQIFFAAQVVSEENLPKGISYEKRKTNNHIIHILKVDPIYYHFELVKAHDHVFGRETVQAIALRKNAIAAINAGFFEIGNGEDGRPSGTLIINKKIFTLSNQPRAYLAWGSDNQFYIGRANVFLVLKIGGELLLPNEINQFPKNNETVLYNEMWGKKTFTPYSRKEVLINKNSIITEIIDHGDNTIPENGWVLSFSQSTPLQDFIQVGQKVKIELEFYDEEFKKPIVQDLQNWVVGIPLLIAYGKIVKNLERSGRKSFIMAPHARTAFGIGSDGKIIMVVVEHFYKQLLNKMTLEELYNILLQKGHSKEEINKMSIAEVRAVVRQYFSSMPVQGLSLPELAKLMLGLGCKHALNLDGGGSASLFLNNRIMNTTVGDEDESKGAEILRPVSNAIVVTNHSTKLNH